MFTTLNKVYDRQPPDDTWEAILRCLNKTEPDDELFNISQLIDSPDLSDALWCLRVITGYDRELRLFAIWCARQVQHLVTEQACKDAIEVAERFANGQATEQELSAAWDSSTFFHDEWTAIGAAMSAARETTNDIAYLAVWNSSWLAFEVAEVVFEDKGHAVIEAQRQEFRRICAMLAERIKP